MKFVLRDYQEEAVQSVFDYFEAGNKGNPLIGIFQGGGKALILSALIERILKRYGNQRILMLTHVKELIEQNHSTLLKLWPEAPVGIFSAGMGKKEPHMPIVFGGIASVKNSIAEIGHRDILVVDEAHLIPPNGQSTYRKVIDDLTEINPKLKVVGLTATPWRNGQGSLTDGDDRLFTDFCCDKLGVEDFNQLIRRGYLTPLIPKRTDTQLDVSGVSTYNGDYALGELQIAVDQAEVTWAALQEAIIHGKDRNCWICFAAGVDHAIHIAEMLNELGIPSIAIHSKMSKSDRNEAISAYKDGTFKCIVNNGILTTGFDHPPIDMMIVLRPTQSSNLWTQMLGRGSRISPTTGKKNCLVLDFAKNTENLGPINDPVKPTPKGKSKGGDAPTRICEHCDTYNAASARECFICGEQFTFKTKIFKGASNRELIKGNELTPDEIEPQQIEYLNVKSVRYSKHKKVGSPDQVKVTYYIGLGKPYTEYVQPEHKLAYPQKRYSDWFSQRHSGEPPKTTDKLLEIVSTLRTPKEIKVWINKKPYSEILGHTY